MTREAVVVFARAPELGRVKTRLAPALGEKAALELHRAFLDDTLASARSTGARVLLSHTRAPAPFDAQRAADSCIEQRGESFGERFENALLDACGLAERVVLVGADSPHVGVETMRAALDALDGSAAVLGPGSEGGFYLLGVRAPAPRVAAAFDEANEAAAVARLLRPTLLAPSFDVDVPADLVNLILFAQTLEAAGEWVPPRTVATLRALGVRVERAPSGARERRLLVGA